MAQQGIAPTAVNVEAAIGRHQRCHGDLALFKPLHPTPVRAHARPTATAQREEHRIGLHLALSARMLKSQHLPTIRTRCPASATVAQRKRDLPALQSTQPSTQQRRRLHTLRKHPTTGAHEGLDAQRRRPPPDRRRRKRRQHGLETRTRGVVITGKEMLEQLRMRQIEPAPSRQQKLSADGRHGFIHRDRKPMLRQ